MLWTGAMPPTLTEDPTVGLPGHQEYSSLFADQLRLTLVA